MEMLNKKLLLIFCLSLFACTINAKPITKHSLRIGPGVNRLIKQFNQQHHYNLNIGIVVQSMRNGNILYTHHSHYLFAPASVQKLFTAIAGLAYLKPTYVFTTSILMTGTVIKGSLHGNLYVRFTGDPELTSANLQSLFDKLHRQGINKINGRVYIDNTAYNQTPYPPGWIWDDLSYSFAAPLDTIIINHNKFLLHFYPAPHIGQRPRLSAELPNHVATFANGLITTKRYMKYCPLVIYSDDQNHYRVSGCLMQAAGEQRRSLAIRNMRRYTQALLKQLLTENHINYDYLVGFHKTPATAHTVLIHNSPTLAKITKEMLKDSDNLTTNAVFKKLGQTYFHSTGTWQNGLRALTKLLMPLTHINFKHNLLADGAGLSRYNLLSPRQISKLLYYAYHQSIIKPVLYNALPIAGKDGTLANRMRSLGRGGRVHAKTGSMTGVTALAGYVNSKHNGVLSFVIMINGFVKPRKPYTKLENKICEWLTNG